MEEKRTFKTREIGEEVIATLEQMGYKITGQGRDGDLCEIVLTRRSEVFVIYFPAEKE